MRYVASLKIWGLPSRAGEVEANSTWQATFLETLADALDRISNTTVQ